MTAANGSARDGWLLAQLPATMARDHVIAGFVRAFEEIADSIRAQVSDLEYELDVDLASPEMLTYLASWLGEDIESTLPGEAEVRDAQRRLIRAVGQALVWRGTRRGVETLLEALTGTRVDVRDSGGVFALGEPAPPVSPTVTVTLDHLGSLTRQQILAFLANELPVGVQVELKVRAEQGGSSR